MTTRLIIARHGNTFLPSETPRRIGAATDLDLTESVKAAAIGTYLQNHHLTPDIVFAAPLKRTMQTASIACEKMGINPATIIPQNAFKEIDYGIDENKTEAEVIARLGNNNPELGQQIIDNWNKNAIVPPGWLVNPNEIIRTWKDFAQKTLVDSPNKNTLIVSSNGIIRFAPYITGDFTGFTATHNIKVAPGALCIFEYNTARNTWHCTHWNVKCYNEV